MNHRSSETQSFDPRDHLSGTDDCSTMFPKFWPGRSVRSACGRWSSWHRSTSPADRRAASGHRTLLDSHRRYLLSRPQRLPGSHNSGRPATAKDDSGQQNGVFPQQIDDKVRPLPVLHRKLRVLLAPRNSGWQRELRQTILPLSRTSRCAHSPNHEVVHEQCCRRNCTVRHFDHRRPA